MPVLVLMSQPSGDGTGVVGMETFITTSWFVVSVSVYFWWRD